MFRYLLATIFDPPQANIAQFCYQVARTVVCCLPTAQIRSNTINYTSVHNYSALMMVATSSRVIGPSSASDTALENRLEAIFCCGCQNSQTGAPRTRRISPPLRTFTASLAFRWGGGKQTHTRIKRRS